jgi:hypothetical protein
MLILYTIRAEFTTGLWKIYKNVYIFVTGGRFGGLGRPPRRWPKGEGCAGRQKNRKRTLACGGAAPAFKKAQNSGPSFLRAAFFFFMGLL